MGCFSALRSATQAFHSHKKQNMKKQKALAKCARKMLWRKQKEKKNNFITTFERNRRKASKKRKLISDPRYVVQKQNR